MDDSCIRKVAQEGVDSLSCASPVSAWRNKAGWVSIDVRSLRFRGVSLEAIGLAASILNRGELNFSMAGLMKSESLNQQRASRLLRELVVAGFLEARPGYFAVTAEHRAEG